MLCLFIHCRADDTTAEMGPLLLAAAVVSAVALPLVAAGANGTMVLNLAFVTSDTGEFVCNGEHLVPS